MKRLTHSTKLRLWRLKEGYSLSEVADLTGISPAMLSRAERGLRHFRPRTKVVMARCLGVPVSELFEVDEPADDLEQPA